MEGMGNIGMKNETTVCNAVGNTGKCNVWAPLFAAVHVGQWAVSAQYSVLVN